jgi:hypothetical protein
MHIKEAVFWIGVALAEASIFVWLDAKHMGAAIILAIVGISGIVVSVYLHHRHDVRIPGWIAFVLSTQLAVFYDYYDRRHVTPQGVMLYITIAIFIAVVYVLYRIANGIYVHKLRIINQHWYEYLKLVNKKLPEATTNEVYASLVNVLLNKLGNMTFEASKAKSGVPPELRYPLSRRIFALPIKEWSENPVDIYLFRRAFLFLRDRLPALEERLPEFDSERDSDKIKAILENTMGVMKQKADELRKECHEKQPVT